MKHGETTTMTSFVLCLVPDVSLFDEHVYAVPYQHRTQSEHLRLLKTIPMWLYCGVRCMSVCLYMCM